MHTGAMPTSHPVLVPHPCAAADAANPPPDQTPCNDLRPQHWVEQSKNGDSWVLSKDGAWDMIKSSSVASLCQQTVYTIVEFLSKMSLLWFLWFPWFPFPSFVGWLRNTSQVCMAQFMSCYKVVHQWEGQHEVTSP